MKLYGYGEDVLTLWALTSKLDVILSKLDNSTPSSLCTVFFRPSFGRRGGPRSSQFGEFDFILLARERLYLGESKWDRSSEEIREGILQLREKQRQRHEVFKCYVEEWTCRPHTSWVEFAARVRSKLQQHGVDKPVAPAGSRLAENLQTVLGIIEDHYPSVPELRDVLLYLYDASTSEPLSEGAWGGFAQVSVDYYNHIAGRFVGMEV
jgi:hypothetical protein